jgi:hypothetical protein
LGFSSIAPPQRSRDHRAAGATGAGNPHPAHNFALGAGFFDHDSDAGGAYVRAYGVSNEPARSELVPASTIRSERPERACDLARARLA